ncbi:hypothetical protein, partial [uncultured Bacteroides sp.]|uniref:hypothetical protein n=1 Tax=uncultured Bacteroides sp. TaxID=162156 RepID=UPI0025B71988
TPGASQHNGFQDRRNRPLCHLSKTSLSKKYFSLKAVQRYKSFSILQTSFLFFHELIVLLHHDISAEL